MGMTSLDLARYLDGLLENSEIKEYPNALNGLQIENTKKVEKIFAAVDACEATIQAAVAAGADLLLVHHGLFWSGLRPVTGPTYRKLRALLAADIAVYSSHLPLDAHPVYGNNAVFADMLNFPKRRDPFLGIGWKVEVDLDRSELLDRVAGAVGGRVHLAPGGPARVRRVGVVTGGAGGEVFRAAAEGVDTFLTGEGSHWTYTAAEEAGINLIYAGHYATETFGVKALAAHVAEKFGLAWEFFDHPTGL
jgi:dinuclear metal center YbgI/SA1388 family protein